MRRSIAAVAMLAATVIGLTACSSSAPSPMEVRKQAFLQSLSKAGYSPTELKLDAADNHWTAFQLVQKCRVEFDEVPSKGFEVDQVGTVDDVASFAGLGFSELNNKLKSLAVRRYVGC